MRARSLLCVCVCVSCWASSHLPLLQVLHICALEGSFQEVGQLVVGRETAFQVS